VSLANCRALGAVDHGVLNQRDTYFHVPAGRLKLREQTGDIPHLIAYARADQTQQRESRYRIVEVPDALGLKAALSVSLGVKIVVTKSRHLLLWKSVRIHIDEVEGLGNFLELEAVAPMDSDLDQERELIQRLRLDLDIDDGDLIATSYSDLLLASDPT
jgi:predicted adenylyl cyclase CyaB